MPERCHSVTFYDELMLFSCYSSRYFRRLPPLFYAATMRWR